MEESVINWNREDRDLLIELRTEMQNVRKDIKDLKDNTSERISNLEKNKAEKDEFDRLQVKVNNDIDARVQKLERQSLRYIIMMGLYTAGVAVMIGLIMFHIFKQ